MTIFYVELDNWQNVIKCLKSSAEQVAGLVDSIHKIELPQSKEIKTGHRIWIEADTEEEAKREARYKVK